MGIIAWLGREGRDAVLFPPWQPNPRLTSVSTIIRLYRRVSCRHKMGGSLALGLAVCWRLGLQTPVDCEGDDTHLSTLQSQYWRCAGAWAGGLLGELANFCQL